MKTFLFKVLKHKLILLFIFFIALFITIFLFNNGINKNNPNGKAPVIDPYIKDDDLNTSKKPIIEKNIKETVTTDALITCEYKDKTIESIYEPSSSDDIQKNIGYQNNKVGVYIYAEVEEFTDLADKLINSNGGDWGYALIPYNVKDYNETRWNKLFKNLREKHIIPIIQLWDLELKQKNKREDQINDSAKFLNKLDWPIKQRYVTVYNEVNDKKFWGGKIDPKQYAKILNQTIDRLKQENKDFFVMNGAFNASARTNWEYLDEKDYLKQMNKTVPGIFKKLDGWASHPYPQPNFTGSPKDSGRDSIRAYEWELSLLRRYGVDTKNLPVFITETGWPHKEGAKENKHYLNQYQVADNIKYAYENVWLKDDRVVAITPFTIRYNPPYDNWSWITINNNPYPQFKAVQNIKKTKGKPPVVTKYKNQVWECSK